MNLKEMIMQEYFEGEDTHREYAGYHTKIDDLERELMQTLDEKQKKLYVDIQNEFLCYCGLKEELVAEYIWKVAKKLYKELLL